MSTPDLREDRVSDMLTFIEELCRATRQLLGSDVLAASVDGNYLLGDELSVYGCAVCGRMRTNERGEEYNLEPDEGTFSHYACPLPWFSKLVEGGS